MQMKTKLLFPLLFTLALMQDCSIPPDGDLEVVFDPGLIGGDVWARGPYLNFYQNPLSGNTLKLKIEDNYKVPAYCGNTFQISTTSSEMWLSRSQYDPGDTNQYQWSLSQKRWDDIPGATQTILPGMGQFKDETDKQIKALQMSGTSIQFDFYYYQGTTCASFSNINFQAYQEIELKLRSDGCATCSFKSFRIRYQVWNYCTLSCANAFVDKKWIQDYFPTQPVQTFQQSQCTFSTEILLVDYFYIVWSNPDTQCSSFSVKVAHRRTDSDPPTATPSITDPEITTEFKINQVAFDQLDPNLPFMFKIEADADFDWVSNNGKTAYFSIELSNINTGQTAYYIYKVVLVADSACSLLTYSSINYYKGNAPKTFTLSAASLSNLVMNGNTYTTCSVPTYDLLDHNFNSILPVTASSTNGIISFSMTATTVQLQIYWDSCDETLGQYIYYLKTEVNCFQDMNGVQIIGEQVAHQKFVLQYLEDATCRTKVWNSQSDRTVTSVGGSLVWPWISSTRLNRENCGQFLYTVVDYTKTDISTASVNLYQNSQVTLQTTKDLVADTFTITLNSQADSLWCSKFYWQVYTKCYYDPTDITAPGKTTVYHPFWVNTCQSTFLQIDSSDQTQFTFEFGTEGQKIIAPTVTSNLGCQCDVINSYWIIPVEIQDYLTYTSSAQDSDLEVSKTMPLGSYSIQFYSYITWAYPTTAAQVKLTTTINFDMDPCQTISFTSTGNTTYTFDSVGLTTIVELLSTSSNQCPFVQLITTWEQPVGAYFNYTSNPLQIKVDPKIPPSTYQLKQIDCDPLYGICTENFIEVIIKEPIIPNTAPYFEESPLQAYYFDCPNKTYEIVLPQIKDDQNHKTYLSVNGLPNFISQSDLVLTVSDTCINGTYSLSLYVRDEKGKQQTYKTKFVIGTNQKAEIEFVPEPEKVKEEVEPEFNIQYPNPVWVADINRVGVVTIRFGYMLRPPDFQKVDSRIRILNETPLLKEVINEDVLKVEIDRANQPGKEDVEWECIDFTAFNLKLQLYFKEPLDISTHQQQYLSISFIQPELFVTVDSKILLNGFESLELAYLVPTQFANEKDMIEIEEQVAAAEGIGVGAVVLSVFIQILAKKVMSKMWGFFAALQILILITANNFSFQKPANVVTFFEAVRGIIYLEAVKNLAKTAGGSVVSEAEALDPSIKSMMGLLITGVGICGCTCCLFCLKPLQKNKYVNQLIKKVSDIIFYNLLIRFYMLSYISFWYNNTYGMTKAEATTFTYVSGSLFLSFELFVWIYIVYFLFIKIDPQILDLQVVRKRVGNLYLNLQTQPIQKMLYSQFFFLQRTLIIIVIVFMKQQVLQAILLQFLLMIKLAYFFRYRPYRTFDESLSDFLNDIFLVFIHSLQFSISPYVPEDKLRYLFGKSFNIAVYCMLAFNFGLVLFSLLKSMYIDRINTYRKKKAQKMQKGLKNMTNFSKLERIEQWEQFDKEEKRRIDSIPADRVPALVRRAQPKTNNQIFDWLDQISESKDQAGLPIQDRNKLLFTDEEGLPNQAVLEYREMIAQTHQVLLQNMKTKHQNKEMRNYFNQSLNTTDTNQKSDLLVKDYGRSYDSGFNLNPKSLKQTKNSLIEDTQNHTILIDESPSNSTQLPFSTNSHINDAQAETSINLDFEQMRQRVQLRSQIQEYENQNQKVYGNSLFDQLQQLSDQFENGTLPPPPIKLLSPRQLD